jgi:choline monooxygenase
MDSPHFEIDPDIRRASTPPGRLYTDPRVLERQRERVFATSWQLVGDERSVREPGSVQPITLLEGLLDEPLVLARDARGELRCLSNVCTHRGNLVVESACRRSSLVCAYHGRRFRLDGTLESAPELDLALDFPTRRDDLPRADVETLFGFLFASLRPAHAFEELAHDLRERMSWFPFDELAADARRSRDYDVRANWALYCDNYLEGFHIPFLHAALNAAIEWKSYSTELFPRSSLQIALAKEDEVAFEPPKGAREFGTRVAAYYWWLWPNLMLNFYPWGVSVNVVCPRGVDATRVLFRTYVWREELMEKGAGSGLDRVEREDEDVVEAVQKGVRARLYSRGRYSPTREQGVHHFHRMLAEALSG